jgi:hypothetical protein
MEVTVVYLQAILPVVAVPVTGLESNVVKLGGQIEWSEKSPQVLQCLQCLQCLQYPPPLRLQVQKKNCKIHLALLFFARVNTRFDMSTAPYYALSTIADNPVF